MTTEEQPTVALFCVCDEEHCWCLNEVVVLLTSDPFPPDVACAECAEGHHVLSPNGERS